MRRIAESIRKFYEDMVSLCAQHTLESDYNQVLSRKNNVTFNRVAGGDWQLSRIPFERLHLLELRQVAAGSWQPVLSLL